MASTGPKVVVACPHCPGGEAADYRHCSFCGVCVDLAAQMVGGTGGRICSNCLVECAHRMGMSIALH